MRGAGAGTTQARRRRPSCRCRSRPAKPTSSDWSHEIVVMNGVTVTVKVAHLRLCHSRMMFVRAYPRETQELVFDAHERGFAFFTLVSERRFPRPQHLAHRIARDPQIARDLLDRLALDK